MLPFLPHIKPIKSTHYYTQFTEVKTVSNLWYQLIAQLCPTHFKFHLCQVSHKQLLIPALQLQLTRSSACLPPTRMSFPSTVPSVPGQVPRAQSLFSKILSHSVYHKISFPGVSLASFPLPKPVSISYTLQCISGSTSVPLPLLLLLQPVFQDDTGTSPRWWCCGRVGLISCIFVPPSCLSMQKQPCST